MCTDPVGYHLISGFTLVLALIRFSNGDNLTDTLGINFSCYAFENQADTEGFVAMAKRAGYQVVGLPNYVLWHIDTEEKEGNLKATELRSRLRSRGEGKGSSSEREGNCLMTMIRDVQMVSLYSIYVYLFDFDIH